MHIFYDLFVLLFRHLLKINERLFPYKELYSNVHSNINHSSPKSRYNLNVTGEWINELWYIYKYNWLLLCYKGNELLMHVIMCKALKISYDKQDRLKYILCNSFNNISETVWTSVSWLVLPIARWPEYPRRTKEFRGTGGKVDSEA